MGTVRIQKVIPYDHPLLSCHTPGRTEAGTDEVGRGCLAGPVVAAAVILPDGYCHPKLRDSKKMTKRQREEVYEHIKENAVSYFVAAGSVEHIQRVNILNASIDAMHEAVRGLQVDPDFLLVDGNQFRPIEGIPHECVVKGDGKYASIAAAAVLAKVERDKLMEKLAEKYPGYGWETNAGYGTKAHVEAIRNMGVTRWHREGFLGKILGK